jgi:hypothetical protein
MEYFISTFLVYNSIPGMINVGNLKVIFKNLSKYWMPAKIN